MKKIKKLAMLALFGASFMLFSFTTAPPENLYGKAVEFETSNFDTTNKITESKKRRRILRRAVRKVAQLGEVVVTAGVVGATAELGRATIETTSALTTLTFGGSGVNNLNLSKEVKYSNLDD